MNHPTQEQCQSCAAHLKHRLYCGSCDKIQKLGKGDDYFSIFGHPRQFLLDQDVVEATFEELILALHPDFHTQEGQEIQSLSVEHTALLHEAKAALFNPYLRGRYLLSLLVPELVVCSLQPPPSFLIQTFEWQEALEETEQQGGELAGLKTEIDQTEQTLESQLQTQFEQLETDADQPTLVEKIGGNLGQLKFLLNLQERVNQIHKDR